MHLDGALHDVVQHLRGEDLDRGDVVADLAVVLVLVDLPRHVQHEEPELRELGVGVGDVVLDGLLVGQHAALGLARQGPLAHHVERLLAHPDGAHGVVDATAAEPGLGDGEGLALTPRAGSRRARAPRCSGSARACPRGRRLSPISPMLRTISTPGVSVGTRNIDIPWYALTSGSVTAMTMRNDGRPGVGREELPPVDDPFVAVAPGPGRELRRVGATLGLGHRVRREDLTVEQRPQVALLLLVGAVVGDDLGVARVGCLAAEDDRTPTGDRPRISFMSDSFTWP